MLISKSLEGWMMSVLKSVAEWRSSSCLTVKRSCFPYQKDTLNEWFSSENPLLVEDKERERTLNIMNVNKNGKSTKCYRTLKDGKLFPESLAGDSFEAYYHGTNHTGAQKIIENGIKLSAGKMAQDFSCGDGFYLFQSFDEALNWAGHRHGNPAVLCFRVKKTELRGDSYRRLDLSGNKQKWEEVVSKFWQVKNLRTIRKEFREYHFIEGPQASWKNRQLHKPIQLNGTYQLCVREKICARLFDQNLHSIVFFE